jgi:large conductance mechanosensitive channel
MIDMAVGIIIGTTFNNVVQTIVKKVFPPLSMLDGVNFADKGWILDPWLTVEIYRSRHGIW